MKYNTGDKVRIRKDLVAHKKYGIERVTDEMLEYAGYTATITKVTECKLGIKYHIDVDTYGWSWTEEMFEPTAKSKCDFKVGDKVIFNPVEKNIPTGVFTVSEVDTDLSIPYIKLKEVKDMWFISGRLLKVPVFNVGHVITFKNIEDDRWPHSAYIEGELGMIVSIDMHFYAPNKPGEDGNRYCVRNLKTTGLCWYTTSASLEFVPTVASLEDVKSISQDDPGLKGDLGVVVRDDSALAIAQAVDNVKTPQFKIGDKVVIRSDLIPGKKYDEWNGWIFRKEMEHYRGGVATVVGFHDDSRYCNLDIDVGRWSWIQDSLLHYTPGSDHDLDKQIINQQTKQNYENQLQGKEEPLIGGCECTGTGVCYPGEQATACIGHLGYRKVAYKC